MQSQQVVAGVILIIVLGCSCASALVNCYSCDSSSINCKQNVFIALGVAIQTDCVCCGKFVTPDQTTRTCHTGTAAAKCIPLPDRNYICTTDLCNKGVHVSQSFLAVLFGAVAVAVMMRQRV